MKKFLYSLVALAVIFSNASDAKAVGASLYFTPVNGTFTVDGEFNIIVKVNSGDNIVNASEGSILFDKDKMSAVRVSRDNSIFNLWYTNPTIDNKSGTINFGGGIPNPGYKGADGIVMTVTFKALAAGTAQIFFSSGAVLANDGKGTNVITSMGSSIYTINPKIDNTAAEQPKEQEAQPPSSRVPEISNALAVMSATHPDQSAWYHERNVSFNWQLPSDTVAISYVLDDNVSSSPDNQAEELVASTTIRGVDDGVWYFHVKYRDKSGWSDASTFRIQIDNLAPESLDIELTEADNDWPSLGLKAVDQVSGVSRFEVSVLGQDQRTQVLEGADVIFKPSGLNPGEHSLVIKAIDKAGNELVKAEELTIKPIKKPEVKNFLPMLRTGDKLFFSGSSAPYDKILIYIKGQDNILTKQVAADKTGNWYYMDDTTLPNGRYMVWFEAENTSGLKSGPTSKISVLISPPTFVSFGQFVTNYFTVLVSVLFLSIVTILLFVYLVALVRRRLKKETVEVEEVVRKNLFQLKENLDHELALLSKNDMSDEMKREKARLHLKMNRQFTSAEKKIMKEIKDVENILK